MTWEDVDRQWVDRRGAEEDKEWLAFTPDPRGSTVSHRMPDVEYRYRRSAPRAMRLRVTEAVETYLRTHCECDACTAEPEETGPFFCDDHDPRRLA